LVLSSGPFASSDVFADSEQKQQIASKLHQLKKLVFEKPKLAKQQLSEISSLINPQDHNLALNFLLRSAEAENFSYQFTQFEEKIHQGLKLIKPSTPAQLQSMFHLYDGIIKQRDGDYGVAINSFELAGDIALKADNQFIYIYALVEKAFTLSLTEQYETSLHGIQQAYLLADKAEFSFLLGIIEESYGAIYLYMGKYQDSIDHFQKALEIYQSLNYPFYIAEAILGRASTYRYWTQWDKAIDEFQRYQKAVEPISSEFSDFYYNYGTGMTFAKKGDCDLANSFMSSAIKMTGFKDYKAELYKNMAICLAKASDYVAAKNMLENAREIYDEIPDLKGTSWHLEVDKIEAQIAGLKGNFKTAYKMLDSYYTEYLKIHKNNTSEQLEKLKLTMQVERERLELDMLENKSQVQTLKLKQQIRKNELQQTWLIGSILLIMIIMGVVLWQLNISRRLKSLSVTDELTGLRNRRFMFSTLDKLLSHKLTKPVFHSLMLIDVDDLKPINDNYGHQDGDNVLKMVADSVSIVLRYGDVFARVGGDEYMLLLTRSDPEQEIAIANRIIKNIHNTPVVTKSGEVINISVSIGIASIKDHEEKVENIYSRVDKALYRAKDRGRNCISH